MKTVETLLINPPVSIEALYGKFAKGGSDQPPLSLCYLASYLLKYKKEVEILDAAKQRLSAEDIMKEISKSAPAIIGFHTCTPYIKTVKLLASQIKSRWPNILVIAGGPHFLCDPAGDVENSELDVIATGEGEQTCLEIVEGLERAGGDLKSFLANSAQEINGITYKKDGKGVRNPSRELIQDIDVIPYPARHLLPPLDTYRMSVVSYKRLPATGIVTARGCPFRCTFCINSIFKERVRLHSVDYIIGEVDELINRYKIRDITFLDDVLTVNKERTRQICDELAKRKDKLTWSCNIRIGLVDKEILKYMKKAGCWLVMVGVESGNQEILDRIKKQIKLEQAVELCNWCKEAGLMVHPNFIIGHPGETEETIDQTINFAKKLYSHYPLFTLMTPFPGTELWNMAKEYGELKADDFDNFSLGGDDPCFIPHGLSKELLIAKRKEAYRKCYLNFPMMMRHLRSLKSFEDIKRLFQAAKILLGL